MVRLVFACTSHKKLIVLLWIVIGSISSCITLLEVTINGMILYTVRRTWLAVSMVILTICPHRSSNSGTVYFRFMLFLEIVALFHAVLHWCVTSHTGDYTWAFLFQSLCNWGDISQKNAWLCKPSSGWCYVHAYTLGFFPFMFFHSYATMLSTCHRKSQLIGRSRVQNEHSVKLPPLCVTHPLEQQNIPLPHI